MKREQIGIIMILFVLLSNLSIYRHQHIPDYTFRSEIWTDRAGYHVYLPALFIYQFSAKEFPDSIEEYTGHGFQLVDNKVQTKYTYGVALMQTPFFLVAHFVSGMRHFPQDGYSFYYKKAIDKAAVFYLVLGLLLLYNSVLHFIGNRKWIILLSLTVLFLGSNLYYYSIMETGMSHIYSFFLFSALIYLQTIKTKYNSNKYFWYAESLIVSFIILIRPTNLLFASLPILWNCDSLIEIKERLLYQLQPKRLAVWLVSLSIVAIPQMIYWKYAFGSFFKDTYTNEGFVYLTKPHLLEVLFAPTNGLFPYSLVMIGIVIGIVLLFHSKHWMGKVCFGYILGVVYLTGAWFTWQFGCGCGMRNMVEYYSILAFPLTVFLDKVIVETSKFTKTATFILLLLVVFISFKVNYNYYGCYFAETWNWSEYTNTLLYGIK